MEEKLAWIFELYDVDSKGYIRKEDMLTVMHAIYDMMGKYTDPPMDDRTISSHAADVFQVIQHSTFCRQGILIQIYKKGEAAFHLH